MLGEFSARLHLSISHKRANIRDLTTNTYTVWTITDVDGADISE